jgi:hypothetical protein
MEKELNKKDKDKVSIVKQQEEEVQLELETTIVPHKNHTLWEINKTTLAIKKAEFNLETTIQGSWTWKKGDTIVGALSLIRNQGCEYVSALSKETALKHYMKGSVGSKIDLSKEYLKL